MSYKKSKKKKKKKRGGRERERGEENIKETIQKQVPKIERHWFSLKEFSEDSRL